MNKQFYQSRLKGILKDPSLNREELEESVMELFDWKMDEASQPEKLKHWPGRYEPEAGDKCHLPLSIHHIELPQLCGISCETEEEAKFIKLHLEAKLELIETLTELNGGNDWIDWNDKNQEKWIFHYQHKSNRLIMHWNLDYQLVPDYFYAKSREILKQVSERMGDEKIKLALMSRYER